LLETQESIECIVVPKGGVKLAIFAKMISIFYASLSYKMAIKNGKNPCLLLPIYLLFI
tara:strand:- start:148 stop:321 length:174 start_codon:yes stop_codon:yes gene_type:complete